MWEGEPEKEAAPPEAETEEEPAVAEDDEFGDDFDEFNEGGVDDDFGDFDEAEETPMPREEPQPVVQQPAAPGILAGLVSSLPIHTHIIFSISKHATSTDHAM